MVKCVLTLVLQALKENRNKAYEDFIAVGEHLIETGVCKPKTLGIRGGSNGGLLMGNVSFSAGLLQHRNVVANTHTSIITSWNRCTP